MALKLAVLGAWAERLTDGWRLLILMVGVVSAIAWVNQKAKAVVALPAAVEELRAQHDAQTAVMKDQREYKIGRASCRERV